VKTDFRVDFLRRLLVESRVGGKRLFDFLKSKIFPDFWTLKVDFESCLQP